MAGHSHAKNVQHKKNAVDRRRSKIFTKIQKEITVAVKVGGADEKFNPRLRLAKQNARFVNMPNDKVLDAIKRAVSGAAANENYEEIYYLASFGGGVVFLIKSLTDNKTRTAGEVRSIITKYGGSLEATKVDSFFANLGAIYYLTETSNFDDVFEKAAEADAISVENVKLANESGEDGEESYYDVIEVLCNFKDFALLRASLEEVCGEAKMAEQDFRPHRKIEISEEMWEKFQNVIAALEGSDDVSNIYKNF